MYTVTYERQDGTALGSAIVKSQKGLFSELTIAEANDRYKDIAKIVVQPSRDTYGLVFFHESPEELDLTKFTPDELLKKGFSQLQPNYQRVERAVMALSQRTNERDKIRQVAVIARDNQADEFGENGVRFLEVPKEI